jgi:thioredoxin-related protein
MKLLSIIFLSIFSFTSSVEWTTDFAKAKTEASTNNKYILLNFSGSDWCGPCMKLKKEVLDSEDFLKFAETKLVLVRADFPRSKKNKLSPELTKHNEGLAEKYNNEGKFPLTVLIDANGNVVKSWDGYNSSTMTIANMKAEIEKVVRLK